MKKTPFFYLVAAFVILNIMDIVTTLYILPGESNPIYLLTGNILFMFAIKIMVLVFILVLLFKNRYKSQSIFYFFITILVYGSLALLLAQIGNIYAIMNPQIITEAAKVTTIEKINSYNQFMTLIYFLPIAFSMLCFWIYQKSVPEIIIVKKKEKFFSKRWFKKWKFLP